MAAEKAAFTDEEKVPGWTEDDKLQLVNDVLDDEFDPKAEVKSESLWRTSRRKVAVCHASEGFGIPRLTCFNVQITGE